MIVKICGITRIQDARHALQAGADWIGLNLVGGPRRIGIARAVEILSSLDEPSRAAVLLSVDDGETMDQLSELHDRGVRWLQPYGNVCPATIAALQQRQFKLILPWKAGPLTSEGHEGSSWQNALDNSLVNCEGSVPHYLLLDAVSGAEMGGTGRQADWPAIASWRAGWEAAAEPHTRPPFILAGGLNPGNVAESIAAVCPDGVDVSSGVELAPGHKSATAIRAFIENARRTICY